MHAHVYCSFIGEQHNDSSSNGVGTARTKARVSALDQPYASLFIVLLNINRTIVAALLMLRIHATPRFYIVIICAFVCHAGPAFPVLRFQRSHINAVQRWIIRNNLKEEKRNKMSKSRDILSTKRIFQFGDGRVS